MVRQGCIVDSAELGREVNTRDWRGDGLFPRKDAKVGAQWAGRLVRTGWLGSPSMKADTCWSRGAGVGCNDNGLAPSGSVSSSVARA